ncbi:helix-turn-helix domain-containing protein [Tsukamurella strandjordii]|uniref:helix-turn-helix domain-containing protein n=1 Tax=Tsukamurella TaxID=2060 RepID=UPI001C7CA963|nr:XRE family transcriptional regulator [Tsukamurella sp. TY48]
MSAMVRARRLSAGLTLDALAERVGVTKSYLSKVERGRSTPSIAIALRIAEALGVDAAEIFVDRDETDSGGVTIERAAQRITPGRADRPIYDPVAAALSGKQMHPFVVHPPHEKSDPVHHDGDEFVYVIAGTLGLTVDGTETPLETGDCAYFSATLPHRLRSLSETPATALLVTTVTRHHAPT